MGAECLKFSLLSYIPGHVNGGSVSKLNVDGVLDLQAHLQDEYRILNIV